jgi:hypothetical protein
MAKDRAYYSIILKEDDYKALEEIKAYYGMSSNAAAIRRTLAEHAKTIKAEEARDAQRVTYSRRVH